METQEQLLEHTTKPCADRASNSGRIPAEDPLALIPRIVNWLYSRWLVSTYPFHSVGTNFRAHSSCEVGRTVAPHIKIGDGVWLDRDVWLNIPFIPNCSDPVIILDDGCRIGRRCTISAQNRIHLGRNSIFAPSVILMDHGHELETATLPSVGQQGSKGGTIRIEEGCWLGFRVAVVCTEGELVIGKNSVIGANSVVTRSIPPFSVVAGNPGRIVKHYEPSKAMWVLGSKGN
jgi:acetyltransferase-like isoleucine patch superfamily enzyme